MKLKDKNLYYIGGVVRDELLGRESIDIDYTYVGDAIKYAQSIAGAEIKQVNEKFGTVRIVFDNEEIDIASTRDEKYPRKGHLPEVYNIGCGLKEDVLRRDFTINALAKSTYSGKIIDYTGGIQDLKNKKLRVLHDESFTDDPTRIVRALKFAVRFGFELEEHTKHLQEEYLKNINYDMSYKRLQKELKETFSLNKVEAFERFISQGIYKLISANEFEMPCINVLEQLISNYKPRHVWIIYIGLLPDISRLPLTKIERKITEDYHKLCTLTYRNDFEIYKNFEKVNIESIIMFAINNKSAVTRYLEQLRHIKVTLSGKNLQALGIEPSGRYNDCFEYILKEKLKNPDLTFEDEINLASRFFK